MQLCPGPASVAERPWPQLATLFSLAVSKGFPAGDESGLCLPQHNPRSSNFKSHLQISLLTHGPAGGAQVCQEGASGLQKLMSCSAGVHKISESCGLLLGCGLLFQSHPTP